MIKNIDPYIKETINKVFNRNEPFNSHIISPNGYYQIFILEQKTWITNLYKKYIKCKNIKQIREILFYLIVIKHSIDTQHYYHIKSKGKKYEHVLTEFKELFDDIEQYVDNTEHNFITAHKNIEKWGLFSRIDLIDENNNNWYIKCSNDISLKHTIVAVVSHLINNSEIYDDFTLLGSINNENVSIRANYINLMKGDEITYVYTLALTQIKRLISLLTDKIIYDPTIIV